MHRRTRIDLANSARGERGRCSGGRGLRRGGDFPPANRVGARHGQSNPGAVKMAGGYRRHIAVDRRACA